MTARRPAITDPIARLFMRVFYQWRYLTGKTPWDTNITPAEVVQLVEHEKIPPGRALDVGCGTGTNAIYLARHGWQTVGIDYVPQAIDIARRKARTQITEVDFRVGDVLSNSHNGTSFDLILDIGCFHSLTPEGRAKYADNMRRWTRQDSLLMLYAFFPHNLIGRSIGISRADMTNFFARDFVLRGYAEDGKSAWYRWQRE